MGLAWRFQGADGRARLLEALQEQETLTGEATAIAGIASLVAVRDVAAAEVLIQQDAAEDGVYFILAGTFRVLVNGREVAIRRERELVGEMAAADPSAGRTA